MYYVESTLGDHPAPPISVIREIKSIADLLRVKLSEPHLRSRAWSLGHRYGRRLNLSLIVELSESEVECERGQ